MTTKITKVINDLKNMFGNRFIDINKIQAITKKGIICFY